MMDPQSDEWLMNDVISSETTQKGVCQSIAEYNKEFPIAVEVLERRIAKMNPSAAAAPALVDMEIEDEEDSDEVATYSVGDY
eukprot:1528514-Ditylum_brightwellii.AAC.1